MRHIYIFTSRKVGLRLATGIDRDRGVTSPGVAGNTRVKARNHGPGSTRKVVDIVTLLVEDRPIVGSRPATPDRPEPEWPFTVLRAWRTRRRVIHRC